ncbi:hypothetical protein B0H17DRAFT_69678 [Mycena rosella]|uniref:Uncharacterized protein n=1 Tax=Mycena rosella TaxID=1033263 RepID=A0AAD7D9J8_MYCRO|nr:hypothetical protein B0H17DRAFT_69678 [Mycena rosella]
MCLVAMAKSKSTEITGVNTRLASLATFTRFSRCWCCRPIEPAGPPRAPETARSHPSPCPVRPARSTRRSRVVYVREAGCFPLAHSLALRLPCCVSSLHSCSRLQRSSLCRGPDAPTGMSVMAYPHAEAPDWRACGVTLLSFSASAFREENRRRFRSRPSELDGALYTASGKFGGILGQRGYTYSTTHTHISRSRTHISSFCTHISRIARIHPRPARIYPALTIGPSTYVPLRLFAVH